MHLMIDPKVKPTAYHPSILVRIHWWDDVKAGLDENVSLGGLEPVPVGEPVILCHRMVICAKKNRRPGRTINFHHSTLMQLRKLIIPSLFPSSQVISSWTKENSI